MKNKLNRALLRVLLGKAAPRIAIAGLSTLAAYLGSLLNQNPEIRDTLQQLLRIALDNQEFQLSPPVLFAFLLLSSAWLLDKLATRYRAKILQTGLGDILADGDIGPKTIKRALSLRLIDKDAADTIQNNDLIGLLSPDTPAQTEATARAEHFRLRNGQPSGLAARLRKLIRPKPANAPKTPLASIFHAQDQKQLIDPNRPVDFASADPDLKPQHIDQILAGDLAGQGAAIFSAAKTHGLDPAFLAALIIHETANGSALALRKLNNPGGIMDPAANWTQLKTFGTFQDGLAYTAGNLGRSYLAKRGLKTIGDIQKLYAPTIGAKTRDPGHPSQWTAGVTRWRAAIESAPDTP